MKTRPDERLPYRELARQDAHLVRRVAAGEFSRLAEVAPGQGEADVELHFRRDAQGRPWVSGSVSMAVRATCQRCAGVFDHRLAAGFDLCIVEQAQGADTLAADVDVLVADSDTVTVAEVVEDELILGVPEQLCRAEPCEHAPALSYPAPTADADGSESDDEKRKSPFEILATLKS